MKSPDDNVARDQQVSQVLHVLEEYSVAHPSADIKAYRQNSASIRARIMDPDFRGQDRVDRERIIWNILDKLSPDIQNELTLLLLLTPEEANCSFANFEFDNPIPSQL